LPSVLRALPPGEPAVARPLFARNDARVSSATDAPASRAASLGLLAGMAGALVAVSYATMEQFLVPIRGSREFGLERAGIARVLVFGQAVDVVALLPLGRLADRRGAQPVLAAVLLVIGLALGLIGLGTLPLMIAGCAAFGLGMAGWNLPVSVLRSVTPPGQIAWRAALYRVAVDGGMCVGPLIAGVLTARHERLLPALLISLLTAVAVALLVRRSIPDVG
jgi:MFS family permease